MKKIQKLFGMFQETVLEPHEKMEVEAIKLEYDTTGCNPRVMRWEIWDMQQTSRSYEEFIDRLRKYLGKRFFHKWQRSETLEFDMDTWEWLINHKNREVHFDLSVLNNYNRSTGYIGTFRGTDCFVKIKKEYERAI